MPKKLCFQEINYPKVAYAGVLFLLNHSGALEKFAYPMLEVTEKIEEMANAVKEIYKDSFQIKKGNVQLPERMVAYPLTLDKLVPLKPEYWQVSDLVYQDDERKRAFYEMFANPLFYKLLVVPSRIAKGKVDLQAAMPFSYSVNDKTLEHYFVRSNQVVDTRAKHAALYRYEEPFSYNWVTGERKEIPFENFRRSINKESKRANA